MFCQIAGIPGFGVVRGVLIPNEVWNSWWHGVGRGVFQECPIPVNDCGCNDGVACIDGNVKLRGDSV